MTTIYALKLVHNKFYVSSTYNIHLALKKAFSNTEKDKWLKTYKPLYVHKVIHNCDPDDEYYYLVKYIRKYGVENVRGPTFDAYTYEQELLRELIQKS